MLQVKQPINSLNLPGIMEDTRKASAPRQFQCEINRQVPTCAKPLVIVIILVMTAYRTPPFTLVS